MTVYVRNTETGGVVGVSEELAADLCRSEHSTFERVEQQRPVAKKAPTKKSASVPSGN